MSRLPVPSALLPLLLACLASLSLWPQPASALKTDTQQPVTVAAGKGEVTMREGHAIFGGGVQIDQGTMRARSATADVTKGADGSISTVLLIGTPATLAQTMDDGQKLDAEASSIRYDVAAGLVVLEGNAKVRRGSTDRFEGSRIEYEPATTLVRADGQGKGPVTFTFQPAAKPAAAPATETTPAPPAPTTPTPTPDKDP